MKNLILKTTFLIIYTLGISICQANTVNDDTPTNYSEFKKNKRPKNVTFELLTKSKTSFVGYDEKIDDFYTIYKKDTNGNGYYFKVIVDRATQLPIATYLANEKKEKISVESKNNAVSVSKTIFHQTIVVDGDPIFSNEATKCVIKCHRENGCYDKPTNLGAALCSADCMLSCDDKTSSPKPKKLENIN